MESQRPLTYSCFIFLSPRRHSALAIPFLLETTFLQREAFFLLHALSLTLFRVSKMRLLPILAFFILSRFFDINGWPCSFSFWKKRVQRLCQLLSLWRCWSRKHHQNCQFIFLFSSQISARSLLRCSLLCHFFYFTLSGISDRKYLLTSFAIRHNGLGGVCCSSHQLKLSFSYLSYSFFFSNWRQTVSSNFFDKQVPTISTEELVLLTTLVVSSLIFAAKSTAFC